MDRKPQTELQAGPVLERGELPALAVQLDGGDPQVGLDEHEPGNIELELRFHRDARVRGEVDAFQGCPLNVHARVERAFKPDRSTDLNARRRADDRYAHSERSADEHPQAGVRRNVEVRVADDYGVFFVRRVVGDRQLQLVQLAGTDAC